MVKKENNLSWQNQLKRLITTPEQLAKYINLTENEIRDMEKVLEKYPMSITPYYASLMDKNDKDCPIRKMVLPNKLELFNFQNVPNKDKEKEFTKSQEQEYEEIAGLRQEYTGKGTILITLTCPNYCRYCFRKYWVGRIKKTLSYEQIDKIIDSIAKDKGIKEVCISGGDPLILSDRYIDYVLEKLKNIPHVDVVRLYSRMLVTLPQRITDDLVKILKKHPTLYLCTHFNHPKELTPEAMKACRKIVNNGIPILNQSVLLKGVNDNTETMKELLWGLVKNKIKPFYLQHCIKQTGNDYLVTKIDVGTKIIRNLYCNMSAIAIPLYDVILYGGKALMMPDYIKEDASGEKYITNLKGEKYFLRDLEPEF